VVAEFPDFRLYRLLPGDLLHPLLHNEVGHSGLRLYIPLLRLHLRHGVLLLLTHRNDRVPGLLLVRQEDLQCCQGGLIRLQLDISSATVAPHFLCTMHTASDGVNWQ